MAFGHKEAFVDVSKEIIETKTTFDGLLKELKQELIARTKGVFLAAETKTSQQRSLADIVEEWCESLDPLSFEQLFTDGTDRFLRSMKAVTNDEDLFISRLAKLATGLRLEDWDDKTEQVYFQTLARYVETAKAFHGSAISDAINETSSYQVTFADEDGEGKTRRFERVEVSARGKLLFNQITAALDAMGQSISEQEKRQILMEVLKKLC